MSRKVNEKGLSLIKDFEGLRLEAYQCSASVWTIGYGHTEGVKSGHRITKEVAEKILMDDLDIFESGVNKATSDLLLSDNEFSALVSLSFNIGLFAFQKSTLLKNLRYGKKTEAAAEFLKWNKAGGKVSQGLARRRKAEQVLFNTKEKSK